MGKCVLCDARVAHAKCEPLPAPLSPEMAKALEATRDWIEPHVDESEVQRRIAEAVSKARAEERERCVRIAEQWVNRSRGQVTSETAEKIAAAIRAGEGG